MVEKKREYRKASGLEVGDKPLVSVPLRFDLECSDDLQPLVLLLRDRALAVDKRAPRPTTRAKLAEALDLLLANLINAYRLAPHCFVGVSRSENDYIIGRYQKRKIGFNNLKIAYDYLIDANLVSFAPGFNDRKTNRAFTSRMKAIGHLRLLLSRYKRLAVNKRHASTNLDSLFLRLLDQPIGDRIDIPQSWVRTLKPMKSSV